MKQFIIVAVVLGGFALAAAAYSVSTWEAIGPTVMGFHGWFALSLMVVFTLGFGVGLMWLVFYSARKGYDDQQKPPADD